MEFAVGSPLRVTWSSSLWSGSAAVARVITWAGASPHHEIPNEGTGRPIKDSQSVVKPLGLVDQALIAIRPHIVGIVHIDLRKRDLSLHFPGLRVHSSSSTGLILIEDFLELGIHPHLAHTRCGSD